MKTKDQMAQPIEQSDANEREYEPRSSKPYLDAIERSRREFDPWRTRADRIDKLYSSLQSLNGLIDGGSITDREFNLFWASVEVIKPSIYARAPVPVVSPKFKDRSAVKRIAAELLERSAISGFDTTDIDQVMLGVRDDLVIVARGVIWVTYEDEDGKTEKVCVEHLDRDDFLHDPVRKWSEVSWVARRAWLTLAEMRERFSSISGDLYLKANYTKRLNDDPVGARSTQDKAGVWEIWDKAKDKVVWVTDGCDEVLEEDEPHLKLEGFFPCPRPAYGTMQRRSLVPVPDIVYIESQLGTINELTTRIHDLSDKLVVKGIIPAGTDMGDVVEAAYREENAAHMLIPVPSMSLTSGASKLVEWLPIDQVAQTILAAVETRRELISDVQQLLGVSDIQRADTQAEETLGAQRLKMQQGSVRVRDRVNELVRIARDTVHIMSQIMAEEFDIDTLLMMAQMELPTGADVSRQLKDIEKQARKELTDLTKQAEQMLMSPEAQQNPQESQGQFQQAQQQIVAKYTPQIKKLSEAVTQEAVEKLLDDDKTRPFVFDIETDSTIYPDEMAEKQARNEFMQALGASVQALMPMVQTGGAQAAGEVLKWNLEVYRPGRGLMSAIDDWIDALGNMPAQSGQDDAAAQLAAAQQALAQAELQKAQAQTMKVEADAQGKMQQIQLQAAEAEAQQKADQQRFALEVEQTRGSIAETMAKIEKIKAEIEAMGVRASNETRTQNREDVKFVVDTERSAQQDAMAAENQAFDQTQRLTENERTERQQGFNEQHTVRQQEFAERQAEKPDAS